MSSSIQRQTRTQSCWSTAHLTLTCLLFLGGVYSVVDQITRPDHTPAEMGQSLVFAYRWAFGACLAFLTATGLIHSTVGCGLRKGAAPNTIAGLLTMMANIVVLGCVLQVLLANSSAIVFLVGIEVPLTVVGTASFASSSLLLGMCPGKRTLLNTRALRDELDFRHGPTWLHVTASLLAVLCLGHLQDRPPPVIRFPHIHFPVCNSYHADSIDSLSN